MPYNILIVEDQNMPRKLLEIYVSSDESFRLVGSITNAASAVHICRNNAIDLIIMDVMTELGHSGLDAAKEIKEKYPKIKIIIVTSMPEYSWIRKAKDIGIESFWYKNDSRDNILDIMKRTINGESIYPESTPFVKVGNTSNHEFTERELEILKELITGDSNTEIAERLHVSPSTVKFHIQNLLDKTGFHTRTELASEVRSLGIVIRNSSKNI